MTVFRVQVFYQLGLAGKWSNVYHVDAAGIADAIADFDAAATAPLLSLLDSQATLVKYLVSDLAGTQFSTVPKGLNGTSTASGDLLPLFNSVKVLVTAGAFGRPDYKFYKGFVTESIQTNGILTAGSMGYVDTAVQTMINDMITAGSPLVSENGTGWGTASVQAAVQMRQMHRRRKKKALVVVGPV